MERFATDSPFNTAAAIRARAVRAIASVPLTDEQQFGYGDAGGFGKYEDWWAILP